jgi:photosystem II stability/assembly factor-like uncharacterized protein
MNRTILPCLLAAGLASAAWQSIGPDGGYIMALAIDPQVPARVYAVPYEYPANCRVFVSEDRGASWSVAGTIPYQSVTAFDVDPHDSNLLYALARGTILYRSTDRGGSWTGVTLPGYAAGIAADPLTSGRLYLAGYYSYGGSYRAALYFSTNYGQTWDVSMPQPDTVGYSYAVAADPRDNGTVYLGATYSQLYRSTDAGATWTRISNGIPSTASTQGLSVNAADNRIVLAAQSTGMYRTTDAGANWTLVGAMAGVMGAAFSGADPSTAYCIGRSDSMRVWVSTDSGATWSLPTPGYTTLKSTVLKTDPVEPGAAWLNSQTGIYRSTDRGAHWQTAHAGLRIAKISCISACPGDPSRLYLEVAENGVFRTADAGASWERCNDFLSCGSICGIGITSGSREKVYALEGSG